MYVTNNSNNFCNLTNNRNNILCVINNREYEMQQREEFKKKQEQAYEDRRRVFE